MAQSNKGYRLEELLRAYFLRAGFFAVRGVPFLHAGEDLTDIDIWLYERPTGSSRRRQIVDAKSKSRPKAVERLFWTKGLAQLLDVDGAYVATTDTRPMLRSISKKLGISVLDGSDIKRISVSEKVAYPDRLSEEELLAQIVKVDKSRRNKNFQQQYHDIKHSLIDNFGAGTINRAIDTFGYFSTETVTAHPNTESAEIALRLAYFAGAITAISLDFVVSEVSFRAANERLVTLVNAIRYGNVDETTGIEPIRLAIGLIDKYAPKGESSARAVELAVRKDLAEIPAEIIAEHVVKNMKPEDLFQIGKRLEHLSFSKEVPSFDELNLDDRAFIAVLLDYTGIDRAKLATSWSSGRGTNIEKESANSNQRDDGPLFSKKEVKL